VDRDHEGRWQGLRGFASTGFRSLQGDSPVRVGPLEKINFFDGRNNQGKSSILLASEYWGRDMVLLSAVA